MAGSKTVLAGKDSPGALGGVIVRSGRLRTTGTAAAASRGSDGGAPKAGIDAAAAPSAEPATGPELGAVMAVAEASAALAAKALGCFFAGVAGCLHFGPALVGGLTPGVEALRNIHLGPAHEVH